MSQSLYDLSSILLKRKPSLTIESLKLLYIMADLVTEIYTLSQECFIVSSSIARRLRLRLEREYMYTYTHMSHTHTEAYINRYVCV